MLHLLVRLFATPWTVACQAPLSVEFSRQQNWKGLPCPPPGHLPDPGIEPTSPALAGRLAEHQGSPKNWKGGHNSVHSNFLGVCMGDSLISPAEAAESPLAGFATLPAVGPSVRLSGRMSGPWALDLEKARQAREHGGRCLPLAPEQPDRVPGAKNSLCSWPRTQPWSAQRYPALDSARQVSGFCRIV